MSPGEAQKQFEEHLKRLGEVDLKEIDANPDLLDKEYDQFIEKKEK